MDSIRKQTEMCASFAGFFIFHSMGGGTGSGLTTLLMQKLAGEYGKKHKLEFVIYPSPRVSTTICLTREIISDITRWGDAASFLTNAKKTFLSFSGPIFRMQGKVLHLEQEGCTPEHRSYLLSPWSEFHAIWLPRCRNLYLPVVYYIFSTNVCFVVIGGTLFTSGKNRRFWL